MNFPTLLFSVSLTRLQKLQKTGVTKLESIEQLVSWLKNDTDGETRTLKTEVTRT